MRGEECASFWDVKTASFSTTSFHKPFLHCTQYCIQNTEGTQRGPTSILGSGESFCSGHSIASIASWWQYSRGEKFKPTQAEEDTDVIES